MPKLPRISSKETIRTLERLGFEQVRQSGSHVVIYNQLSIIINLPASNLTYQGKARSLIQTHFSL